MRISARLWALLRRFRRDQAGVALVEFAAVLPLMLLLFGLMIESARMLWTHQIVVSGVRDATRYVARVTSRDDCATTSTVSPSNTVLAEMISESASGSNLLLLGVSVNSVSATAAEGTGTYRIDPVCVATVTANVTIDRPFAGLFTLAGDTPGSLTYDVADMARIHGE